MQHDMGERLTEFDLDLHAVNEAEVAPVRDAKGRLPVEYLTGRELLCEIAASQRETRDLVEEFMTSMKTSPMGKMMAGKFGR